MSRAAPPTQPRPEQRRARAVRLRLPARCVALAAGTAALVIADPARPERAVLGPMKSRAAEPACAWRSLAAGVAGAGGAADGDPGSDVLVYQSLFLEADAGVSVSQQARLGTLLSAAASGGLSDPGGDRRQPL